MGAFRNSFHCFLVRCEEKRKMFTILVFVLCYQHIISQPFSTDISARATRELIECCPCPKDGHDSLSGAKDAQAWLGDGKQFRAEDDCPCKSREADSDGSSSLFIPTALRPEASQHRPVDPKEDTKNLLEPEVNLATSVLDTLREVTEEEYRDALDREAARNAADPDAVPEETARNVVIVINPKDSDNDDDDFIAEATHAHESRCIHPIGRTSLGSLGSSTNPVNIIPSSFQLPNLRKLELPHRDLLHLDSNLGASNVDENIVDPNGNVLKISADPLELGHVTPLKGLLGSGKDGSKFPKLNFKLQKFNKNEQIEGSKLPELNSPTKLFDDNLRTTSSDEPYQSEPTVDKSNQLIKNDKLPVALRNLLKLRDVELIPKTLRNKPWTKPKLDISKFAVPTLSKFNQNENCNVEEKYLRDVTFNMDNSNPDQTTLNDFSDGITNASEIKEAELLPNHGEKLMPDSPLDEMIVDFISNENFKGVGMDNMEDKKLNFDILSSPSEIQSSFMESANGMDLEAILSPKSDCNSIDLKESDINNEGIEILGEPPENETNSLELENTNVAPEDIIGIMDDTPASDSEFLRNPDVNINQDSETECSNNILFTLVPLGNNINKLKESQRNSETGFEPREIHVAGSKATTQGLTNIFDTIKAVPNVNEMTSSLGDTLSNIRDHVVKHIENFNNPLSSQLVETFGNIDNVVGDKEKEIPMDDNNNEAINFTPTNFNPRYNAEMKETEDLTNISINDLQIMSDKLLDNIDGDKGKKIFFDSTVSSIIEKTNSEGSEIIGGSESKLSEENSNIVDVAKEANTKEKACSTDSKNKNSINNDEKATKSVILDTQPQEMDTGASNTVTNTLPGILDSLNPNLNLRTPSLGNLGLPPSDPLNLLGKPLGDVLNLNTNLPTLNDLRERLVNILNPDNESTEDESSSLEADFSNDSPLKTMATEASTRTSQKEFPTLKRLGESNNNIIQNKPKLSPTPLDTLTKSRMVDLSSYRAHLPSPHTLELKPLKIEPRVLTPTEKTRQLFNLGTDKTMLRKAKPTTLVNPLDSLPSLEELRNSLRTNTRNLLDSPTHSSLSLLPENLRSHDIENVAKSFQLNTEKTLKGLQRKMKTSLRKPNTLEDSLAKQQELIDDMNDKLKGLHYDLNDRLSSLRESILDSTRLRTINEPRKTINKNVSNLRKSKTKSNLPRLQTAASTTNPLINANHLPETRHFTTPDWNRSQKMQNVAESALIPTRVEVPKLVEDRLHRKLPFKQNPVTESLGERIPTIPLNRDVTNIKDVKNPLFRTTANRFIKPRQENKITISFGTTTVRPILLPRPVVRVPNTSHFDKFIPQSRDTLFGSTNILPKENVPTEPKVLGRFKPLRTSAPLPSPVDEDYEDALNNLSKEQFPLTDNKLKSSVFRETFKTDPKTTTNSNNFKSRNILEDAIESKSVLNIQDRQKSNENSFLTKVRNATNMRKIGNIQNKQAEDAKTEQGDMLRSATENKVIVDESLKENVSYRCRMVCTKERK